MLGVGRRGNVWLLYPHRRWRCFLGLLSVFSCFMVVASPSWQPDRSLPGDDQVSKKPNLQAAGTGRETWRMVAHENLRANLRALCVYSIRS